MRPDKSVTLSPSDVAKLQSVFATLVSVLSFERIHDWRAACRLQIESLLCARYSAGLLPCVSEPYLESEATVASALLPLESFYDSCDAGVQLRRRTLAIEVFHWTDMYDSSEPVDPALPQYSSVEGGMPDICGMAFDVASTGSMAGLFFCHEPASSRRFGTRDIQLLRLLLPAFKAGVDICVRIAAHRNELGQLFDTMDGPLAVFDGDGRLLQQNRAMTALLQSQRTPARIEGEITSIARAVGTLLRRGDDNDPGADAADALYRELHTNTGTYRISGSVLDSDLLAPRSLIAITVGRSARTQLTQDELQVRYGLTRRETETARLLAARRGNMEIARALGMSAHTARHHTERILSKLGLTSRREVERALLR